jgi:hypothetical protein
MSCPHRFLGKHIAHSLFPHWEFEYLFIGTFNPSWTFPKGQSAAYFYGRTRNNYYWDLVPEIWSNQKMRRSNSIAWEQFIQQNKIGITDLIKDISDADQNNVQHVTWLKDKADTGLVKFQNIDWNTTEIINLVNNSKKKLKGIFITNQKAPDIIEAQIQLIEQAAIQNNIDFERLITPSAGARFQFPKGTKLYPTLLYNWKQKIDPIRLKP